MQKYLKKASSQTNTLKRRAKYLFFRILEWYVAAGIEIILRSMRQHVRESSRTLESEPESDPQEMKADDVSD
jgi:hypothetical protein